MTDRTEPEKARRGVPLPDTGGQGEQPREIVYARYKYDPGRPTGRRVFGAKLSYVVRDTDVAAFVKSRLDGRPLPRHVQTRQPHAHDTERERQVNIYVGKPCWVVIELEGAGWHFEAGRPGITVETGHRENNCDLEHVMPDGTLAGPAGPDGPGCRLIYFRVQERDDYERQKFYLHIIRGDKRLDDPDQVDPDIPNDGGKFPFPFVPDPATGETLES